MSKVGKVSTEVAGSGSVESVSTARPAAPSTDVSGRVFSTPKEFLDCIKASHGRLSLKPGATFKVLLYGRRVVDGTDLQTIMGNSNDGPFSAESWYDSPLDSLNRWMRISVKPGTEPGETDHCRLAWQHNSQINVPSPTYETIANFTLTVQD